MNVLCLDGLTNAQALRAVGRRFDLMLAYELWTLESELRQVGMNRNSIDAMIEDRHAEFVAWRREALSELRSWLVECNRKLH